MKQLAENGWLFTLGSRRDNAAGASWNYWLLFDFRKVEWSSMTAATEHIALVVAIGVPNLPIFIPAMAISLNVPRYNMDRELFGHGASHLLAGVVGTVPNLVVS